MAVKRSVAAGHFIVLFCIIAVLPSATAIKIYTRNKVYGVRGEDVRLSCYFWSWEWLSDDVTLSWSFRPEGSRETISIFHYNNGVPYIPNEREFKDRVEWVGNMGWRDGSIKIKNLDFTDNGTFICEAKNPPDIVGSPSSVQLVVYEKGPVQAGVVTGAIVGAVLGLALLIVVLIYLIKCLMGRRRVPVKDISIVEKGKSGKAASGRQGQVVYASLDQSSKKFHSEKKSKGVEGSKKEKK
ncbi:myelin protein P0 [Protopterus annectens]|uniref:myelin protein P0 n=1 Tax=Protopterus annectens TaxID=7888 RepID=UPI001CFAB1A1|nr:myelin protein P0 [Protopterus annectens]